MDVWACASPTFPSKAAPTRRQGTVMRFPSEPLAPSLRGVGRMMLALVACLFTAAQAQAQCVGPGPDGNVDAAEQCDDNNTAAGDGCDANCTIEAGWSCDRPIALTAINAESYGDDASWDVSMDGRSATQTVNTNHGTVGLLGASGFAATYSFRISVETNFDDDFFGFVLGFSPGDTENLGADFLLLDWKQETQTFGGDTALIGMALSRVQGVPTDIHLWEHSGAVSELARANTLGSTGWVDSEAYFVTISYSSTELIVDVGTDPLSLTRQFTISAAAAGYPMGFPEGEIGFYGYSQEATRYEVLGPFGASSCNRPPEAPAQMLQRAVGDPFAVFNVASGFMDPDGDGLDLSMISIVSGAASVTSSVVAVANPVPDAPGIRSGQYRICDDHPTIPLCATGSFEVQTFACLNNADCPGGVCDLSDNTCVQCLGDADCTGGVCDLSSNSCVQCLGDGDCATGVCDEPAQACVPCVDAQTGAAVDDGCSSSLPLCVGAACVACVDDVSGAADLGCSVATPVCRSGATPECVVCLRGSGSMDEGCSGATPLCDESAGRCVACLGDGDCAAGMICGPGGVCAEGCRDDAGCLAPERPVCDVADEVCVACNIDADCSAGVCSGEHRCVDCRGDADCSEGVCEAESCVECRGAAQCPEGQLCTDSACTQECRSDADCGEGHCAAGVCQECTRDVHCEGDARCSLGSCITDCTEDADCDSGVCEAGQCAACRSDEQCPDGRCEAGACVAECTGDGDCSGATPHCDAGLCEACTSDAHCAGDFCDAGACVECRSSGDCLPGEACAEGECVGCQSDADCTGGASCDLGLGRCVEGCTSDAECTAERLPRCAFDDQECVECLSAADCEAGELCTPNQRCEAQCTSDAECGEGQHCDPSDGQCVDCLRRSHCESGEACSDRQCIPGCRRSDDCSPPWPLCHEERCVECVGDGDCLRDQRCEANACVWSCASDAECGGATPVCSEGDCVVCTAADQTQCEGSLDGQLCVDSPRPHCGCVEDSDCPSGRSCGDAGVCVEGGDLPSFEGGTCAAADGGAGAAWLVFGVLLFGRRRRRRH